MRAVVPKDDSVDLLISVYALFSVYGYLLSFNAHVAVLRALQLSFLKLTTRSTHYASSYISVVFVCNLSILLIHLFATQKNPLAWHFFRADMASLSSHPHLLAILFNDAILIAIQYLFKQQQQQQQPKRLPI